MATGPVSRVVGFVDKLRFSSSVKLPELRKPAGVTGRVPTAEEVFVWPHASCTCITLPLPVRCGAVQFNDIAAEHLQDLYRAFEEDQRSLVPGR